MENSRLLEKKILKSPPNSQLCGTLIKNSTSSSSNSSLHLVIVVMTHATTIPPVNKEQWTSGKIGGKLVEKVGKLWDITI